MSTATPPPPRTCDTTALAGAACVVTGGLGFIGANLALALHAGGARITVVDALVERHGGDRRNLDGQPIPVVVADIGDGEAVSGALQGADVVFNLAGQVSHVDSMTDPVHDLDLNARSQLAFLETLRGVRPQARIVHTSTRQVYGRPRYLPIDEDHPTEPVDVNGVSKLAGEQFHMVYGRAHGLAVTALRLTNVYGPRQRLLGDAQGFLPIFVRRALTGDPITLYGDGSQLRDCLHVDDVVAALVAAATARLAPGELCNLGHPEPVPLRHIAEIIVDAVVAAGGPRSEVTMIPWPPDRERIDVGSTASDSSKAEKLLGWTPAVDLASGMHHTIAFYRERPWYLSST